MSKRLVLATAMAAAIATPALLTAQKPVPPPSYKAEKCYGIAKAGKTTALQQGTIPAADHPKSMRIPKHGSMSRKDIASASSAAARLPSSRLQRIGWPKI